METIIYDEGLPEEETIKEIDCFLVNDITKQVLYDYSLNAEDYPDNESVQTFIEAELTLRGMTWDSVEINIVEG